MKILVLVVAAAMTFFTAAANAGGGGPQKAFTVVSDATYAPPAPPAPKVVSRKWRVPADTPLRQILDGWAKPDGWLVYWPQTDDSTEIVTAIEVNFEAKDFQEAATRFLNGLPPDLGLIANFNTANTPKLLYINQTTSKEVQ